MNKKYIISILIANLVFIILYIVKFFLAYEFSNISWDQFGKAVSMLFLGNLFGLTVAFLITINSAIYREGFAEFRAGIAIFATYGLACYMLYNAFSLDFIKDTLSNYLLTGVLLPFYGTIGYLMFIKSKST